MEMFDLILFNVGGKPVLLMDFISAVLGLTCVFLAGRNSKYNFWVGYVYTAALFVLFWQHSLLASLMLQPVSLAINVVGHYKWTHPSETERSSEDSRRLKVGRLSWTGRLLVAASVLLTAFCWGWLLDGLFPQDPHPYLDSCVTVLILAAQLLSALKKWDCWILWLLVNVSQIMLHLSVGNLFMSAVCALYLVNGIVSLVQWYRLYKKQA